MNLQNQEIFPAEFSELEAEFKALEAISVFQNLQRIHRIRESEKISKNIDHIKFMSNMISSIYKLDIDLSVLKTKEDINNVFLDTKKYRLTSLKIEDKLISLTIFSYNDSAAYWTTYSVSKNLFRYKETRKAKSAYDRWSSQGQFDRKVYIKAYKKRFNDYIVPWVRRSEIKGK